MNKPIFCIVGLSGAGKSTYLERLTNNYTLKKNGIILKQLKYHTTRDKRYKEEDDYYYTTLEEWENAADIIEYRKYPKIPEDVVYYTTWSDIDVPDCDALICAASIDQTLSYIDKLDNVYVINIEVGLRERISRLLQRCNSEDDYYEMCRRVLEERNEYDKIHSIKSNIITVYNDSNTVSLGDPMSSYAKERVIEANIASLTDYINGVISDL